MTSYASSDDIAGEITSKLERDPELFLVGDLDGTVVATVGGDRHGHVGRPQRSNQTPCGYGSPPSRRTGRRDDRRVVETGITKLRLEVWADNVGGLTFWAERGYELQPDIRYFVRNLDDSSDPC